MRITLPSGKWRKRLKIKALPPFAELHKVRAGNYKMFKAILYVFRPGKDADRVTIDSCTGWAKHAGRFCESRSYEFVFDGQLSSGDVDVILLDKKKPLLRLNLQSPIGKV